ncbi:MAG: hypothetical protein HQM16_14850 [Deltaproteobacteria bacterium]|nr:hypothetical protein [Deltaproteobacteria bacterium]
MNLRLLPSLSTPLHNIGPHLQLPVYDPEQRYFLRKPLAAIQPQNLTSTIDLLDKTIARDPQTAADAGLTRIPTSSPDHHLSTATTAERSFQISCRTNNSECTLTGRDWSQQIMSRGRTHNEQCLTYQMTQITDSGSLVTLISGKTSTVKPQLFELSQEATIEGAVLFAPDHPLDEYKRSHHNLLEIMQWSLRLYAEMAKVSPAHVRMGVPTSNGKSKSIGRFKDMDISALDHQALASILKRVQHMGGSHNNDDMRMLIRDTSRRISLHIYYNGEDNIFRVELIQPLAGLVVELPSFNTLCALTGTGHENSF